MAKRNIFMSNNRQQIGEPTEGSATYLSEEETRQVLTPFAFKIDHSLFGVRLADPWRRLVALLIDLLFVAILSDAPGELLAIVIAITIFRLGSKKRAKQLGKVRGNKRRAIMRFIAAFIVFIVLLNLLPKAINDAEDALGDDNNTAPLVKGANEEVGLTQTIELSALAIGVANLLDESECNDVECLYAELSPFIDGIADINVNENVHHTAIEQMVENTTLESEEQSVLQERLMADYKAYVASGAIENTELKAPVLANENVRDANYHAEKYENIGDVNAGGKFNYSEIGLSKEQIEALDKLDNEQNDKPTYSIVKLVRGIIDDLGLGFGWAAFYFTVFTALWQGQTPGKRLLRIKVLQLDGTPLSMWDSFGRYGGYGAGIATGMLGFIQIFWDANRQMIHDQISATVVISADEQTKVE